MKNEGLQAERVRLRERVSELTAELTSLAAPGFVASPQRVSAARREFNAAVLRLRSVDAEIKEGGQQ